MAERYPDRSFDDDEALLGQISEDYDDYDNQLNGYKEREGAFANMFTSDPRSARLMMEWKNGGDPAVELVRIYGEDILDAIDDPDKQEEIRQANQEFAEKVAKEQEYQQEYDSNLQESLQMLQQLQQEQGLSDEEIDQAMEAILQIAKDAMLGKFSRETVDMVMKALNFDSAVETAGYEGEVRGKNAKIVEQLRKAHQGDGTPQLDGANSRTSTRPMPNLGVLDRYDGTAKNIWERGNEKRITNS